MIFKDSYTQIRINDINAEFLIFPSNNISKMYQGPLHFHSEFEIHYVCEGNIVFQTEDKKITLIDKSLFIIPPNHFHQLIYSSPNSKLVSLKLSFNELKSVDNERHYSLFNRVGIYRDDLDIPEFYNVFDILGDNSLFINNDTYVLLKSYLTITFFKIIDSISKNTSNQSDVPYDNFSPKNNSSFAESVIQYIIEKYNKNPTVKEIAEDQNLSVRQTERLIKYNMNTSFISLLNKYRIITAQRIIEQNKLIENFSLENVGYDVGFNNYNCFFNQFKKQTGYSPSSFKKMCLENNFD